ncbi:MAG: DUF433 domain-containing protein [Heteroscytonema crispum UTEX LB 1556]
MESQLIQSSSEILSGTDVFAGTRVPIQTLIDYLEAGDRLCENPTPSPSTTGRRGKLVSSVLNTSLLNT